MERLDKKSNTNQWNYLNKVYDELVEDIERTRYENKNITERIAFYKTLLQNIPALFIIISIPDNKVIWKNREFEILLDQSEIKEKELISQISRFFETPDIYYNKNPKTKPATTLSNSGIFKVPSKNDGLISYYFKGHNLKMDKDNNPVEIFITAFNLSEKINTDHQLEELVKENKRLKNKIAVNLLTNREKEILKLISEGLSSKKISEKLELSFYTVETHRKNILRKIELNNTAELIRFASEAGLV